MIQPYNCPCGTAHQGREAFELHLKETHPTVKIESWSYLDREETWGHGLNAKTVKPEERESRNFEFIGREEDLLNEVTGGIYSMQNGSVMHLSGKESNDPVVGLHPHKGGVFKKSEQELVAHHYPITPMLEHVDVKDLHISSEYKAIEEQMVASMGVPSNLLENCLKTSYQLEIMKKANEKIALQHIPPMEDKWLIWLTHETGRGEFISKMMGIYLPTEPKCHRHPNDGCNVEHDPEWKKMKK